VVNRANNIIKSLKLKIATTDDAELKKSFEKKLFLLENKKTVKK